MPIEQAGARETFDLAIEKIRLRENSPYVGADGRVLQEAQEKIDMLASSIKHDGQRTPIEIAVAEDGSFFVIDGELRVRAIEQLASSSIKAFRPMYERKDGEILPIAFQ